MSSDPQCEQGQESAEARERLLDAAEKLFAERGFEATSVRDITADAGCNVAAVNYYFGGKDNLYLEVFRRLFRILREQRIGRIRFDLAEAGDEATLELFVESFANAFLEPLVADGRGERLMAFWDREMDHCRVPPEMFLDEVIRPTMEVSSEALAKVGPKLDAMTARLCMISVVGQLMHVLKVKRMFGGRELPDLVPHDLRDFVRHVVRFSVGGFEACADKEA